MTLAASVLDGNRLALARLLTLVENNDPEGLAALSEIFPHTGNAHLVGITGAPGTGKSTLINQIVLHYRHPPEGDRQRRVAIVAVDPSSPFTGGAILGDRVRMRDLAGDAGVFVRSMASRGSLGGLAAATASFVQVLDAAGFELIFIETVGAGQDEVDIARLAHTTMVIEAPGLGDEIQAIKAGLLEIADILVVNKADRPGVENTEHALRNMLELAETPTLHQQQPIGKITSQGEEDEIANLTKWSIPILRSVATQGMGIPELCKAIDKHRQFLLSSGEWRRRERFRLQSELETLVQVNLMSRWRANISEERYQNVLEKLVERDISPRQAAKILLNGGAS